MEKELFGNFRFMERDFEKCDGTKDGARYVRERLKELNKVLEPRMKEIDEISNPKCHFHLIEAKRNGVKPDGYAFFTRGVGA